ncbi:hypothetical protein M197_gp44 [Haloarcula hispanica tailed virus 2]|uniref:Uncharacterized protein n=1 Tax=Haloarcula hispanica tailed virus 2 TaxID=1273751 RepID=R4T694_9CAUD|nr:hypothetical protein M197_gp44 [Haloarcula hispanica tailed virus 2]AGM11209.1 hypothetical protein HHTV2_44 [Haloarcula hispanica tailed virus 2]
MTVSDVEWDVASETRDLIDNNWGTLPESAGPTKPAHIELWSEDEDGNPRKGVDYTEEYILVSETSNREQTYIDGPRDAVDLSAVAFVEVATPQSRSRREELWSELLVIAEYARKKNEGTPGGWDTVDVSGATINDQIFNWWAFELSWDYSAEARTL